MIKNYINFYKQLVKSNTDIKMMYGVNFWIYCATDIINYSIQLIVLFLIYGQDITINGWGRYEVMFFIGTFFIIDSIAMTTFFFGLVSLPRKIQTGELDLSITKPLSTLFIIAFSKYEFNFLINVLYGIIIVIYSWLNMSFSINILSFVYYIVSIIFMLILYFCMMLIIHCISFWTIRIDSIQKIHDELLCFAYKVPGVLYKGIWRFIFMIILPYGLIANFPTECFIGQINLKAILMCIFVVSVYVILASVLWKKGLSQYNSASS